MLHFWGSIYPFYYWYGDAWEVECAGEKQAKERIEKMNE